MNARYEAYARFSAARTALWRAADRTYGGNTVSNIGYAGYAAALEAVLGDSGDQALDSDVRRELDRVLRDLLTQKMAASAIAACEREMTERAATDGGTDAAG